jgi:hypothetical protein
MLLAYVKFDISMRIKTVIENSCLLGLFSTLMIEAVRSSKPQLTSTRPLYFTSQNTVICGIFATRSPDLGQKLLWFLFKIMVMMIIVMTTIY